MTFIYYIMYQFCVWQAIFEETDIKFHLSFMQSIYYIRPIQTEIKFL
jgi:hypothetical protein